MCVTFGPQPLWQPGEVYVLVANKRLEAEKTWLASHLCFRQAFNSETDSFKLAYGGHQYHASCANFWINCVEPKPPGLILPDLLWKDPLRSTVLFLFCVFSVTPLGTTGPINRIWVRQGSPPWICMNSPRGRENAVEVPHHSYRWPFISDSYGQSLGFEIKLPT